MHNELVYLASAKLGVSVLHTVYSAYNWNEIHPDRNQVWGTYVDFKLHNICPDFLEQYALDVLADRAMPFPIRVAHKAVK